MHFRTGGFILDIKMLYGNKFRLTLGRFLTAQINYKMNSFSTYIMSPSKYLISLHSNRIFNLILVERVYQNCQLTVNNFMIV